MNLIFFHNSFFFFKAGHLFGLSQNISKGWCMCTLDQYGCHQHQHLIIHARAQFEHIDLKIYILNNCMISNRFQISETNSKNVLFYFFEQNQYHSWNVQNPLCDCLVVRTLCSTSSRTFTPRLFWTMIVFFVSFCSQASVHKHYINVYYGLYWTRQFLFASKCAFIRTTKTNTMGSNEAQDYNSFQRNPHLLTSIALLVQHMHVVSTFNGDVSILRLEFNFEMSFVWWHFCKFWYQIQITEGWMVKTKNTSMPLLTCSRKKHSIKTIHIWQV